jgi:hypothetical protein
MNEVCELTEMELEAVSGGGLFDGGGLDLDINIVAPVNVAIGGFAIGLFGGTATGGNALAGTALGANLFGSHAIH